MRQSAWNKCLWCERKLNGYEAMQNHTRTEHQKEHTRATLEWGVGLAKNSFNYHNTQLKDKLEYERFLAANLDYPKVQETVRRELAFIIYSAADIAQFMDFAQKDLAKAAAALATFDAEHPDIAAKEVKA